MEQEQVQIAEPSESLPSDVALEDFIQHHIFHPKSIKRELDKLPAKTLRSYHYGPHNGLIHCIVENLVAQKHASSFDNLIERYKPLLRTLVYENGLEVNDVNDHHETPLTIAYKAYRIKNREIGNKVSPLINFLETQLHADPDYWSTAPELRELKKIAWEFITCQSCRYKDE